MAEGGSVSETTEKEGADFRAGDNLKPSSPEESAERAMYLTSATLAGCADFLQSLLLAFRNGQFGEALSRAAARSFSDQEFMSAVKELACVSIYLTVLEQGGQSCPQWLTGYLFTSLRSTDKLPHGTRARELMQVHEFVAGAENICADAAAAACRCLGLSAQSAQAAAPMAQFLMDNTAYRAQLLAYSLTQPLDVLHRHIESIS